MSNNESKQREGEGLEQYFDRISSEIQTTRNASKGT